MVKRRTLIITCAALCLLIAAIIVGGVLYLDGGGYEIFYRTYLQNPEEIYDMEAGIIKNNLEFQSGQRVTFNYDLDKDKYADLLHDYNVEAIAGQGGEFTRAKNLMHEFAPRLVHRSDYENDIRTAQALLEYALDNKDHGINCRAKAEILNEMCLGLGICARKVWIMPYSEYDGDCHVVNEVWDSGYGKWIMLDITNDTYWVDEENIPLSIMEIRDKIAMQEFCTPVEVGQSTDDLPRLREINEGNFLYIAKNMVYMEYTENYTVGEDTSFCVLEPINMDLNKGTVVSRESVERAPKSDKDTAQQNVELQND